MKFQKHVQNIIKGEKSWNFENMYKMVKNHDISKTCTKWWKIMIFQKHVQNGHWLTWLIMASWWSKNYKKITKILKTFLWFWCSIYLMLRNVSETFFRYHLNMTKNSYVFLKILRLLTNSLGWSWHLGEVNFWKSFCLSVTYLVDHDIVMK